jgi:CheY-like chemotaxis protein
VKLKVLVVEDEAVVAMLLEDMLDELGHEVAASAGRFEQAMNAISSQDFDLAILDVNLNGVMTYPLAERLKEKGVSVVFATGYGADGLREDWRSTAVVQKPFHVRDLSRAIAQARGGAAGAG